MSYGYGGRPNPFDQREEQSQGGYQQPYMMPGASAPQYGRNNGPAMGRDDYNGQNVEMAPLTQNGSSFGSQQDPNAILNECREISRGIDDTGMRLKELRLLQQRTINESDSSRTSPQLDALSSEIMSTYRNFASRIKAIKRQPESGSAKNAPQLGQVDRKLKAAVQEYRDIDVQFEKDIKGQLRRQYKIVRPDASEKEVEDAIEDPSQQVFSQALLNGSRQGQAQSAMNAVRSRHDAIQKIEKQMIELAELFQDMNELVVQQEAAVVNIEMKGEEVVENMDKGTQEIGTAIKSARNARKWKWWCLGICVLIVIIIVVIVLIYKFVIQNNGSSNKTRRSLLEPIDLPIAARRVISGNFNKPSLTAERRRRIKFSG